MPSLHIKRKTKIASPPAGSVSSSSKTHWCWHSERTSCWRARYPTGGKKAVLVKGKGEVGEELGMQSCSPCHPPDRQPASHSFLHFAPRSHFQTQTSLRSDFTRLPSHSLPCVLPCFHDSAFSPTAHPSSKHDLTHCDFLIYLIFIATCNKFMEEKIHPRLFTSKILPPA